MLKKNQYNRDEFGSNLIAGGIRMMYTQNGPPMMATRFII